jgi:hypothetical protein
LVTAAVGFCIVVIGIRCRGEASVSCEVGKEAS